MINFETSVRLPRDWRGIPLASSPSSLCLSTVLPRWSRPLPDSFTAAERLPLIYFLILFPVLVLIVFAWLVSKHSGKLFAPSDFRDEENYVKMQMAVVASLGAATAKGESTTSESEIEKLVEVVRATGPARAEGGDGWRNHILWGG